jgi:hypothetical protein
MVHENKIIVAVVKTVVLFQMLIFYVCHRSQNIHKYGVHFSHMCFKD